MIKEFRRRRTAVNKKRLKRRAEREVRRLEQELYAQAFLDELGRPLAFTMEEIRGQEKSYEYLQKEAELTEAHRILEKL